MRPDILMRLAGVANIQEAATLLADETQPSARRSLAAQLVALQADDDTKKALTPALELYSKSSRILLDDHAAQDAVAKMQQYGWTDISRVRADLRDQEVAVERRRAAAIVLADLRDRGSVGDLIATLAEGDRDLAWACSAALIIIRSRRHGRRLVGILRKHGSPDARQAVIHSLWLLFEKKAEGALIHIADDLDAEAEHTRLMATEALGNTVDRHNTQHALARRLFDPSVGVRYSALCALCGLQGVPGPIPEFLSRALHAKVDDPESLDDRRVIAELAAQILNRNEESGSSILKSEV